ncbi:MAG TPA: plastocyanin/azurin family copper-binding protein [Thermoanaerobaculia bacterium]|nr:plastocyanin/azurin family copper-binding protein [Thermoanaerobaculia bacterium]
MARIRTLAFLLLALTATASLAVNSCGGGGGGNGGGSPTEPRPGQTIVVQVKDFSYEPKSITIEPGDTVRWVLSGADHTHTVTALNGAFDSGMVFSASGAIYERRFDTTGTFDYSCKSHKLCCQMQGSVRVGSNSPPPSPGYE